MVDYYLETIEVYDTEIKKWVYEGIYFFEMNTKYISSNVLKVSAFSRVRSTSEIDDILNTWDEIFLVFTEKSKFSFYFMLFRTITESRPLQ